MLPAGLRVEPPQGGDHGFRIQPPRVIDIDVGQANHPVLVDWKGGGHGQVLRALRAVERLERLAERAVKALQCFAQLENEAKLAGHLVAPIAQHGKREFVFFLGAQGSVRQLRRDGDELGPKGLQLRQRALEAPQVQVTMGHQPPR